jgi:general secretion pathway protein F
VLVVVPRFLSAFETFRIPSPAMLRGLGWLGDRVLTWGPVFPVLLIVGWLLWVLSGTSAGFRSNRGWSFLRILPWMRDLIRQHEAANFADMLGLLVEHGVPYPEALTLASEATGDASVIRLGNDLAAAIARGDAPRVALGDDRALPPLLRWLLASGPQQAALAASLHGLATIYRRRARHQADKIRVFLPIVLLLVIGLSSTLLFGLAIFLPFSELLENLATPG